MSSVIGAAWRISCTGLRASSGLPATCRPVCRDLRIPPQCLSGSISKPPFGSLNSLFRTESRPTVPPISQKCSVAAVIRRGKKTATSRKRDPNSAEILPQEQPFSHGEIAGIFGRARISTNLGNRTIAILHARRLAGTLDLDLPVDITRTVTQTQLDAALQWLRANHPVDEDAAILARIEKEEQEEEERARQAEKMGLYKPQSGSYGAELGKNKSVYGKSVLEEARLQNEKRLLEEKERKRRLWLDGENVERERLLRQVQGNTELQQYEEAALTEARPRADPNERPVLAWHQKHHLAGTHNQPDAVHLTTSQRLLAPLLFTLATLGLCYSFAQKYDPPARQDRLWPDVPPAVATVGAIVGANLAVTLMWKYIPPAWRLLNRFFVIVPFYPSSLSILGGVFSHQTWRHLSTNMMVLALMGTRVHDEIGRGNFLAIYLASGAIGSMFSLSRSVVLGYLGMSSCGASAATSGIVAAWCMYHFNDKITMWILPHELRETIWTQGWIFFACLITTEVFGMLASARFLRFWPLSRLSKMDHIAHLGGYLTGAGCGYALLTQKQARERERKARESNWLDNLVR